MNLIRQVLIIIVLASACVGCATHAKIDVPATAKVHSPCWQGKSFNIEIYYSQPEPGIFNSGIQQDLKPLSEARLSVGAVQVLSNLPRTIMNQLPIDAAYTQDDTADYSLTVELTAHHKRGPTYSDYKYLKNFGKGLITLGFGADEYNIIADFNIKYILSSERGESVEKEFIAKESVDHGRSAIEFKNNTYDYATDLLTKHVMITSSEFLEEASHAFDCQDLDEHHMNASIDR